MLGGGLHLGPYLQDSATRPSLWTCSPVESSDGPPAAGRILNSRSAPWSRRSGSARTVKVAASQASYTTGDHGSQYLSIDYSDRLLAEGTDTSTGRVGSSYDNAAAEALSKSYKCELIWTRSWKDCDDLEAAVAEWVD